MANDANATGTVATNGLPSASTMLPLNAAWRPGWPSLKMITPDTPAASAFFTFAPKLHVPRWIRAILPANELLKSPGAHPLWELGAAVGGMTVWPATATWAPVTVPLLFPGFQSLTRAKLAGAGETSLKVGV